jgi:hypothetical protein
MKQRKEVRNLAWGEYIVPDQDQNSQIAGARWKLMEVVREVLPRFFEQLREQVYPTYARLAEDKPGYWETGWTFETWQLQSDRDRQVDALLGGVGESFPCAGGNLDSRRRAADAVVVASRSGVAKVPRYRPLPLFLLCRQS